MEQQQAEILTPFCSDSWFTRDANVIINRYLTVNKAGLVERVLVNTITKDKGFFIRPISDREKEDSGFGQMKSTIWRIHINEPLQMLSGLKKEYDVEGEKVTGYPTSDEIIIRQRDELREPRRLMVVGEFPHGGWYHYSYALGETDA